MGKAQRMTAIMSVNWALWLSVRVLGTLGECRT